MDRVDIEGLTIAYRSAGRGEPLFLLHGGLSDSREWTHQLDGLSNDFRVVAWDAPGCGGSSDPPESFRLGDYAEALAGFIRTIGYDRAHILGLSFGGGLALELYRRRPRVARSLILASAYAGWAGSLPDDEVARRLEAATRDAERPGRELSEEWMPSLFHRAVPPEIVDLMSTVISEFHPAGARAMAHSFAEADLRDVLPTIDVPTLLLYGDEDVRAPRAVARSLHEASPGSRLIFIPDAGHQTNLEASDRFNEEVTSFLRSIPGA